MAIFRIVRNNGNVRNDYEQESPVQLNDRKWYRAASSKIGMPNGDQGAYETKPQNARAVLKRWRGPLSFLIAVLVILGLGFGVPLPYVIEKPGPTFNVLGDVNGYPVIEISGAETADNTTGQLRMVTVSSYGGPGSHVSGFDLLATVFQDGVKVTPEEEIYPKDISREELNERSKMLMATSQSTAAAAALEELGYDVKGKATIAGAVAGSHADALFENGTLKEGDVLVAITTPDSVRHPVDKPSVPFALSKQLEPETPVTIEAKRGNETITAEFKTYLPEHTTSDFVGSKFGIYLTTEVELPIDVKIHLEDVGGPSAGGMFALGIIDELTGGDSTGGAIVAGTGSIGYDGEIQPIGGIVQKMYGAKRDGAQWFLAPKSNCDEVVGNIPEGLEVWPISSLKDARAALSAIKSGATIDHPECKL